jgi:hypothetical protein
MRRVGVLLIGLVALLAACGGAASQSAPARAPSASASPVAAWPIIGHWQPSALTRAEPGLVVSELVGTHRSRVVVLGLDDSVKATLWRSSRQIVHFDCDPASGEIVATLLGPFEGSGYRYEIVLLSADGTVRRVTSDTALGWEALPSPLVLADGSILWQRMGIVNEREVYAAWYAASNGRPQPVRIVGHLPRGFALSSLLPLTGRRTVALVNVTRTGAVALADWSAGQLTVVGKPYVRKFAAWNTDDPPGGALASANTLVLQGYAPGGQMRLVRWVDGRPISTVVLSKLPPEPFSGDETPASGSGPAGYVLLYGWWPSQVSASRGTTGPMPLLLVSLHSGAVTRSRIELSQPDGLSRTWQWLR